MRKKEHCVLLAAAAHVRRGTIHLRLAKSQFKHQLCQSKESFAPVLSLEPHRCSLHALKKRPKKKQKRNDQKSRETKKCAAFTPERIRSCPPPPTAQDRVTARASGAFSASWGLATASWRPATQPHLTTYAQQCYSLMGLRY